MKRTHESERREWPRIKMAFPIFVRVSPAKKPPFVELAIALNVSAGGLLLATTRKVPEGSKISLEVPRLASLRLPSSLGTDYTLRGRLLRIRPSDSHYLNAIAFTHPLPSG